MSRKRTAVNEWLKSWMSASFCKLQPTISKVCHKLSLIFQVQKVRVCLNDTIPRCWTGRGRGGGDDQYMSNEISWYHFSWLYLWVMSKTEKTPANDIEHLKEKVHKAESSVSLGLEATFIRLVVLRKNNDDHIDTYSFRSLNSIILCLSKI